MKKIVAFSLVFTLLSVAVLAQGPGDKLRHQNINESFKKGQLTRGERFELRKNQARYHTMKRRAHRDGRVTPYERRKLHKTKAHNRRETFRFKHNRRHRML